MSLNAFFSSMKVQMKIMLHTSLIQFIIIIQPILYGTLMYLMFKNSSHDNFIGFIVLGTGMMNLWSSIVFSAAGSIDRERRVGTLEILNAVPTSFQTIMFGKIVGSVIVGLLSSINGYVFIVLISGQSFAIVHILWFIVNLCLVILSYIAISIMLAAFFALSRQVRDLVNAAEYPVFILTGLIFPIAILPLWTRPLSYILTPTWGIKVLRMCINGITNWNEFYGAVFILFGLTSIYLIFSIFLYRKMMKSFRKTGSLGVI